MGRHRPKDRKHKGDSAARWENAATNVIRIYFEDKSRYKGALILAVRHKNGVGRPPLERVQQLLRRKYKIYETYCTKEPA